MKDDHRARKAQDPDAADGHKIGRVRADGIIDSDSEDERVVQAAKRKSPPNTDRNGKREGNEETTEVIGDSKQAKEVSKSATARPAKRIKTAA